MSPLPLRERITAALHLEPMNASELALVLSVSRGEIGDELLIMRARGDVRELPNWAGWVNARRNHARAAA